MTVEAANCQPSSHPLASATRVRRLPAQKRSRDGVATVLRAAQALIERDGYDRVTTKTIADAAGVSVGMVYGYFPNKEAIIFELGRLWMETIRELVSEADPARSGLPDVMTYLDYLHQRTAEQYQDRPGLGAVINMLSAVPELREAEVAHDRWVVEAMTHAIRHYLPAAPVEDIAVQARFIAMMTHAVLSEAYVRRSPDAAALYQNLRLITFALLGQLQLKQPPPPQAELGKRSQDAPGHPRSVRKT